jgi:hypothetical protein
MADTKQQAQDLIIGESIDRLVNVEMNPHLQGGRTYKRYQIAREKQESPLTYLAATRLIEAVKPGDFVFFLGGAGLSPWLEYGETDGPAGVISLARALNLGLDAIPVFIGDKQHMGPIAACGRAAGLLVLDREAVETKKVNRSAIVAPFTLGPDGAVGNAKALLDEYQPSAVISVEKQSPNELGAFHTSRGWKIPASGQAFVYEISLEADRRDIFTLGIGDGGNEIGWGLVQDEYNKIFQEEFGQGCFCGCGGGQATNVSTDVLVCACTSNWGAYGVSACLGYLLQKSELIQDSEMERRMVEAMAMAGAVDVIHGTAPYVDGTSLNAQLSVVNGLREIITNALMKDFRSVFPPDYSELVRDIP